MPPNKRFCHFRRTFPDRSYPGVFGREGFPNSLRAMCPEVNSNVKREMRENTSAKRGDWRSVAKHSRKSVSFIVKPSGPSRSGMRAEWVPEADLSIVAILLTTITEIADALPVA